MLVASFVLHLSEFLDKNGQCNNFITKFEAYTFVSDKIDAIILNGRKKRYLSEMRV